MRHVLSTFVAAGIALCAGQASAHAFLKTAAPAVGSTVAQPPTEVVIAFTEGVEPRFSTIEVQDASGARVDTGEARRAGDATHLAVGLKSLEHGTYTVVWHATAVDTHKTEGKFTFTVGQ